VFLVFVIRDALRRRFAFIDTFIGHRGGCHRGDPRAQKSALTVLLFRVVIAVIAAGFYFVTIKEPYVLWLFVAPLPCCSRLASIRYCTSTPIPAGAVPPGIVTKGHPLVPFISA